MTRFFRPARAPRKCGADAFERGPRARCRRLAARALRAPGDPVLPVPASRHPPPGDFCVMRSTTVRFAPSGDAPAPASPPAAGNGVRPAPSRAGETTSPVPSIRSDTPKSGDNMLKMTRWAALAAILAVAAALDLPLAQAQGQAAPAATAPAAPPRRPPRPPRRPRRPPRPRRRPKSSTTRTASRPSGRAATWSRRSRW